MSGSDYERELRDILEDEYNWLAIRAAGSMGKGDLLALHRTNPYSPVIVEVKKISTDTFYSSNTKKNKEQFEMMKGHAERGFNALYAIRHTSGSQDNRWQMHWVDPEDDNAIYKREDGLDAEDVFFTQ